MPDGTSQAIGRDSIRLGAGPGEDWCPLEECATALLTSLGEGSKHILASPPKRRLAHAHCIAAVLTLGAIGFILLLGALLRVWLEANMPLH